MPDQVVEVTDEMADHLIALAPYDWEVERDGRTESSGNTKTKATKAETGRKRRGKKDTSTG